VGANANGKVAGPKGRPPLCARDLADLRSSGITDLTIWANRLHTEVDEVKLATMLNQLPRPGKEIPWFCGSGGLVFPYRDLDGKANDFVRVKPHDPRIRDGKPNKYEQPRGVSPRAYFPAVSLPLLRDGDSDIYLTEGEKKALALAQLGLAAVGVGGVWSWKSQGPDALMDDLAAIPWRARVVFIVFDYDPTVETRASTLLAAKRLARCLRRAGAAEVNWVVLPPGPGNTKQGVDDFLVRQGAGGPDAFRRLADESETLASATDDKEPTFANYHVVKVLENNAVKEVRRAKTLGEIYGRLTELFAPWPRRAGGVLFVPDGGGDGVRWLAGPNDLMQWVGAQMTERPVCWCNQGVDMVPQAQFFLHVREQAERCDAVELLPHYPPLPGHYYLCPEPEGGDGEALRALLGRFTPATETDRALMEAAVLTLFWGGPPGRRPAFLIECEPEDEQRGRGAGKTTFAEVTAGLAGGYCAASPSERIEDLKTRLLSPAALTLRVGLLDNLKTLRFSSADLEGLITADTISGRQLYVGEGRRPNTLTWFITLNGASLSKDLAQRVVPIWVRRPEHGGDWEQDTRRFIAEHRREIIGDILALLEGPKAELARYSRWSSWEAQVLACVEDPGACQRLTAGRQAGIDGDQEDADLVRDALVAELRARGHDPDTDVIFLPSAEAARIVNDATGEKRATNKASAYLGTLAIGELRKGSWSDGSRGWRWLGRGSSPGQAAVMLGQSQAERMAAGVAAWAKDRNGTATG
jgi:hypothetical protein